MQSLRVVGLHDDGQSIVCEDSAGNERFLLPIDERLRAAARGDAARLGQIERESTMRPREIQTRIRSGASVEEVASATNMPVQRIERFAYPVLLERSRTVELAQQAHPMRDTGPDVQTLNELVASSFGARGQDYTQANWDAWRGDDGRWIVGLRWQAGRSENRARWSFSPGVRGGTVTALDELAESLLEPNAHRGPRALEQQQHPDTAEPEPVVSEEHADAMVIEAPIPNHEDEDEDPSGAAWSVDGESASSEHATGPALVDGKSKSRRKTQHPPVPAWEDVLLGVRSQRG